MIHQRLLLDTFKCEKIESRKTKKCGNNQLNEIYLVSKQKKLNVREIILDVGNYYL